MGMAQYAMTQTEDDKMVARTLKKIEVQRLISELRDIFTSMDADQSGSLSLGELQNAPEEARIRLLRICDTCNDSGETIDLEHVFRMLDHKQTGQVSINDFCNYLLAKHEGRPIEVVSLVQHVLDM